MAIDNIRHLLPPAQRHIYRRSYILRILGISIPDWWGLERKTYSLGSTTYHAEREKIFLMPSPPMTVTISALVDLHTGRWTSLSCLTCWISSSSGIPANYIHQWCHSIPPFTPQPAPLSSARTSIFFIFPYCHTPPAANQHDSIAVHLP